MIITFKFRVKDGGATKKRLALHARSVNFVWNYCCQIQREAESRWKAGRKIRWPTAFDLIKLCTGSAAELGLHSDTVQTVCRQFAVSRNTNKKCPRFRATRGPRRALGWVPLISRAIKVDGDCVTYLKRKYRFWHSREIEGDFGEACFNQDARGRWYISFGCRVERMLPTGTGEIGIDLGLSYLATCSDGTKLPALQHYRRYEVSLGCAQRAGNKRRVAAINAKIRNSRHHHLHEQSTKIARENALIVVGDVSVGRLVKTRMAKSILDASWSTFRNQLRYKASRHGARYVEADERWTSQVCSCCGTIPVSSPKGMGALGIRHWVCTHCGASHDRDINAARNILRVGAERRPPAEEIPHVRGRR